MLPRIITVLCRRDEFFLRRINSRGSQVNGVGHKSVSVPGNSFDPVRKWVLGVVSRYFEREVDVLRCGRSSCLVPLISET